MHRKPGSYFLSNAIFSVLDIFADSCKLLFYIYGTKKQSHSFIFPVYSFHLLVYLFITITQVFCRWFQVLEHLPAQAVKETGRLVVLFLASQSSSLLQ